MFFGIEKNWVLCGWKKLPFALENTADGNALFFDKEQYAFLLKCDGQHDLDPGSLSGTAREQIRKLIRMGIVVKSDQRFSVDLPAYFSYPVGYRRSVQWSITGSCNYRCRHCLMSAPEARFPHPSFEQLIFIADRLKECGVHSVNLTGGEPLIRRDFLKLADALTERGIHIIRIFTNGKLVTRELLEALRQRNIHCEFQMSFDGTGGWHDWMRGVEGASKDVEQAIRLCVEYGFPVTCAMCLHKKSVSVLRDSVCYLGSLGVRSLKVNAAGLIGDWKNYPDYFLPIRELFDAFLDYIPQYFEDDCPLDIELDAFFLYKRRDREYTNGVERDTRFSPERCLVCTNTKLNFYIGSDGSVVPCMSMAGTPVAAQFYNIFDTDLKEILDDSSLTKAGELKFRDIIDHNPECASCSHTDVCHGGCRARATGERYADYLRTDPTTCEFLKGEWKEKIRRRCGAAFAAYRQRKGIG